MELKVFYHHVIAVLTRQVLSVPDVELALPEDPRRVDLHLIETVVFYEELAVADPEEAVGVNHRLHAGLGLVVESLFLVQVEQKGAEVFAGNLRFLQFFLHFLGF